VVKVVELTVFLLSSSSYAGNCGSWSHFNRKPVSSGQIH